MGWTVDRWRAIAELDQRFGDRAEPPPPDVKTLWQVHGRDVFHVDEIESGATKGDGLATEPGAAMVGVWTADCVPVHLVAPGARVALAVHCGWRGSAAGILPAALDLLKERWGVVSRGVEAALGPSIGGCCYEVGPEVHEAFVDRVGPGLGGVGFERRGSRFHLDLRTFLAAELQALGIGWTERIGPCTACSPDVLHSYRKGSRDGRQLSWIGWR